MKKLSTLITILCIFFIGYTSAFASCSGISSQNGQLSPTTYSVEWIDTSNNSNTSSTNNSTPMGFGPVRSVYRVNQYFTGLGLDYNNYVFSGAFQVGSSTANSFYNYFINTLSAPFLINSNGDSWGTCSINSISLSPNTSYVYAGSDRLEVYSIPYTVTCYTGNPIQYDNAIGLRWFFDWNHSGSFSLDFNMSFTAILNEVYTAYNGEYVNQLCQLQEAIENLNLNGISVTVDQSPVTNSIGQQTQDIINNQNNNTQQVVDQLTDESCVACDNLANFPDNSLTGNGVTRGCIGNKCFATGTFIGSGTFPIYNGSLSVPAGTYYIKLSKPLPRILYPFWNQDNCSVAAGSTDVQCTLGQSRSVGLRMNFQNGVTYDIQDLEVYIGPSNEFCSYGSQVCTGTNKLDNISNSIDNVNDTLNDSNTSEADSSFSSFVNNFEQDDYGFSDFFTLPIRLFQDVLSATCRPLELKVPYLKHQDQSPYYITLPCYEPIIDNYFDVLLTLNHVVVNGMLAYYCLKELYRIIFDMLDPTKDNLDVFDL